MSSNNNHFPSASGFASEDETIIKHSCVYSHSKKEKLHLIMTNECIRWQKLKIPMNAALQRASNQLNNNSSSTQMLDENCNADNSVIRSDSINNCDFICACKSVKSSGVLRLEDVIGMDQSKASSNDNQGCFLKLFTYPKCKKPMCKSEIRKKKEYLFYFHEKPTFVENFEEVKDWISVCNDLILSRSPQRTEKKKLLILVNPFGGAGKAMQVYKKKVVPILKEADVRYQTIETEYAGHAKDLIKNLNLFEIRGIVVVSGDGLVFEVINGLMEREDRLVAIKVPIGVIPGGSGNALICSVLYQAGESYLHNIVLTSTLFVTKNHSEPMDLVAVETSSNKILYSILSVAWGIVADVDIESEKYRYLGKARFTVGAVKRIVNLRKYKGTLSFLLCSNDDDTSTKPSNTATADQTNPKMTIESQNQECLNMECQIITKFSEPIEETSIKTKLIGQSNNNDNPSHLDTSTGQNEKNVDSHRPAYTPNSLTTPVPDNWTKISADDFVSVVAMYQTHLAQDMKCLPSSRLQDGCIYLNVIKGNVSRSKMLHYFNAMEDGTLEAISDPYCNLYKVKAFRIEPFGDVTSGIMTVDGERVQYGPIQGWVNEGMCRVMKAW